MNLELEIMKKGGRYNARRPSQVKLKLALLFFHKRQND